jgi:predicted ArsR family transcriptional regulator
VARLPKDSREDSILDLIGDEPVSATELHEKYRMRIKPATVSRHLQSLHEQGLLSRRWDGNERFGRFVYRRRPDSDRPGNTHEG